jgi:hypothetical protein
LRTDSGEKHKNIKEKAVKKLLVNQRVDWGGLIPLATLVGLFLISII